jgi:thioredoxin 1
MKHSLMLAILLISSSLHAVLEVKNDKDLQDTLLNTSKPVVVDFFADWCSPCKKMKSVFEEVAANLKECLFVKFDVENSVKLVHDLRITSIPTIMVFRSGKVIATFVGIRTKEECIRDIVQSLKCSIEEELSDNSAEVSDDMLLIMAVSAGDEDQVKSLIQKGADVNQIILVPSFYGMHRGKQQEYVPLMAALNNKNITKILLDAGANPLLKIKHADGKEYTVLDSINKSLDEQCNQVREMISYIASYKKG